MPRAISSPDKPEPKMITQSFSVQTRLPKGTDSDLIAALDAVAAWDAKAYYTFLAESLRGNTPKKNEFCRRFNITARQFNAIKRTAEGLVKSRASNILNYIEELDKKIKTVTADAVCLRKTIAVKKAAQKAFPDPVEQVVLQKGYRKLATLNRKQTRLEKKVETFRKETAGECQPSICMGTKKLFHAQYHLKENGFKDHQEWKHAWQRARSHGFMILGSKDENAGCQGCVIRSLPDGTYTLTIRLPDALHTKYGHHIQLSGLTFSYGVDVLNAAIESNRERAHASRALRREYRKKPYPVENGVQKTHARLLADMGRAITYRFVRDEKRGWRVILTTDKVIPEKIITHKKNGVIGIDLNEHHLAILTIDAKGVKVAGSERDLFFRDKDSRAVQTRTRMQTIVKQIVAQAAEKKQPIAIEDLCFKNRKQALVKGKNPKQNKTVSHLTYRLFRDILIRNAQAAGVRVIAVPAYYTSLLGKIKYLNQTGFAVHRAAALVIARRAAGFREQLPKFTFQRLQSSTIVSILPEECIAEQRAYDENYDGYSYPQYLKRLQAWFESNQKQAKADQDKVSRRAPTPAGLSP